MRTTTLMSLLAFPLALAACDSGQDTADMNDIPMAENEMMMDGEDMPMMEPGSEMQTVSAEGTVTAIDAEAGTITVDHGPVPAIEWPAMTMAFEADEQLRSEVSVGEGIAFEFRTGSEGNVITSITKQ
ncbi:copper-binding protein [Altererythrobacter arenosus]|uniref:Copper-binding protein n=1 Tax=Altererythrobacter arenosus TaxID=3032592 RepID=A0ABY8FTV0_9SPHN|nr:copper-binding protein [Altererythrobacter sp. CAU 1644]WFL77373.1 copper-binding protein [Altererythrobacter sp. CAU 1644]